jgi:5-methyltetrahydropteroyltriglutamate--homocysteine methyltransferase
MKRSTERILTTHVGSLPRPADLLGMLQAKEAGQAFDAQAHTTRLHAAVGDIVRKQVELGIDIIDDGEYGKPSFVTYMNERLGGFEPAKGTAARSHWLQSREALSFPEFYNTVGLGPRQPDNMICTGPIVYQGHALLKRDIDNLKAALADAKQAGVSPQEVFMPAISPSNLEERHKNAYYKSEEEFLFAFADAIREEYNAIVDAGFLLQIDDPRLVCHYNLQPTLSVAQCRTWAEPRIAALNHALRDIAPEKIRFHTCYGINMGPRVHDMELKDVVDLILKVRAGAYSFEAANPRHEHEWTVWQSAKLPDDKVLIPGVISHSTVLVEHPELVAERIARFANVVGRERVIAGADCGFATFAGSKEVHPTIVWAKLDALSDGARIASERLWGR